MLYCDTIFYLIFNNYFKDKYHAQMKEAQQVVTEKTSALEAEAYKTKRLQVKVILIIKSYLHFLFPSYNKTHNIENVTIFKLIQLFLKLKRIN